MNPQLLILSGPSCSGKSTFSNKRAKESDYKIISRDSFREALFGVYRMGTKAEEAYITDVCKGATILALSLGFNVILDNTHLKLGYIRDAISDFNDYADIHIYFMPELPTDVLLERNGLRNYATGKYIPVDVILNQQKAYKDLISNFKGDKFIPINTVKNDSI